VFYIWRKRKGKPEPANDYDKLLDDFHKMDRANVSGILKVIKAKEDSSARRCRVLGEFILRVIYMVVGVVLGSGLPDF
jgi:hypothetical protein